MGLDTSLKAYLSALKRSGQAALKSVIIIPASLILYIVFGWLGYILSPLGIVAGFLLGFAYIFGLCIYYSWLKTALENHGWVNISDLLNVDWSYFNEFLSVGFILWIIGYLFQPFADFNETRWLFACFQMALFILLNPIPEVIYLDRLYGVEAIKQSIFFVKTFWIEWFIPILLPLVPLLQFGSSFFIQMLAGVGPFTSASQPLLPPVFLISKINLALSVSIPWLHWGIFIISLCLTHWFMLFRAELYKALSPS